jgi:hypothetical protein
MAVRESDPAGSASCAASSIDRLIERWWDDHFPGSAIARDTQAWNVAHAAKETLKQLLVEAQDKS